MEPGNDHEYLHLDLQFNINLCLYMNIRETGII